MNITREPEHILLEQPGTIPKKYFYFTYTLTNDKGMIVPPSRIKEGEILSEDVHDIKGVRIFKKGRKVTKADLRILRRAAHKPIIENNKRKPPAFFKIGDTLPDDVKDFDDKVILAKGTVLDARTRSILLRMPLRPVYVQRTIYPSLDISIFYNFSETMECLHGCDETFDITNAYPETRFNCNTSDEELLKLGIKRITKDSIFEGEDGVWGCSRDLIVSGLEYPAIVNKTVEDEIWKHKDKVCHHCHAGFNVLEIKRYKKPQVKCPKCSKMFFEDLGIHKPGKSLVCPDCEKEFKAADVNESIRYQIECPACGQWLKKDYNYVEISYPTEREKEELGVAYGKTVRGVAVFKGLRNTMNRFTILVSGLTNRYYVVKEKMMLPISAKRIRLANPHDIKIKVLQFFYKKTGDEFMPDMDFLDYKGRKWLYKSLPVKTNRATNQLSKAKDK